jgi:hypothetical protein
MNNKQTKLKTIELGTCLAGKSFVFEVSKTHPISKEEHISYEVRTHGGYLGSERWDLRGIFETFEEAKTFVDELRSTTKMRAVY